MASKWDRITKEYDSISFLSFSSVGLADAVSVDMVNLSYLCCACAAKMPHTHELSLSGFTVAGTIAVVPGRATIIIVAV